MLKLPERLAVADEPHTACLVCPYSLIVTDHHSGPLKRPGILSKPHKSGDLKTTASEKNNQPHNAAMR